MNIQKKAKHKTAVFTRSAKTSEDNTLIKTLKASLWGTLVTIGVGFLLLLVGTAVAFSSSDPGALIDPVSYVSLYMASFFGGFTCAKLNPRSPYLSSGLAAGVFVILSMIVALAMPSSTYSLESTWDGLLLRLATVLVFFLGTLIGLKGAGKAHKPKKKRH